YSEKDYLERPRFTQPEIQRANLADVILRMKAFGLGMWNVSRSSMRPAERPFARDMGCWRNWAQSTAPRIFREQRTEDRGRTKAKARWKFLRPPPSVLRPPRSRPSAVSWPACRSIPRSGE